MSRANPRFRRANPPLPLPTGNCYQANVLFTSQQQQFLTTLYYQDNQPVGTGVNPGALATAVTAGFASFTSIFATDVSVLGVVIRCLNNPTVPSVKRLLASGQVGTVAGASYSTILAVTIDRLTGTRGQAGRGHVNLGPIPASFIGAQGNQITTAAATAYTSWATSNLQTVITSGGINFTPILFSRGLRTQTPKVLGAAPITGVNIPIYNGTVRRRKIGRGK